MRAARTSRAGAARARAARIRTSAAAFGALLLCSCLGIRYASPAADLVRGASPVSYPSARFAVFSDPHLYDTSLGTEGSAFKRTMDSDRKLLPESKEILSVALRHVADMGVGFLLIPGDLTKDGEKQDHLLMADMLAQLSRTTGVRVFVVPGNHDILNPEATRYDGDTLSRVENVTPAEFAQIYTEDGYGEALYRDPGSLSYVAEPVAGLWLLAVDSASYAGNPGRARPEGGSGLTQSRVDWIESMLARARRKNKAVIAMMHHGVMEHFAGESRDFGRYLLSDWKGTGDMLAAYGVRVVFTGHFHAQDVARRFTASGRPLYDVETGSLITYPDPIRLVTIQDGVPRMDIASSFITSLPSFEEQGKDFGAYSKDFLVSGTTRIVEKTMNRYGIRGEEAHTLASEVAAAFAAHLQGDERFSGTEMLRTRGLSPLAGLAVSLRGDVVRSLWQDTEPADNNLEIDLR